MTPQKTQELQQAAFNPVVLGKLILGTDAVLYDHQVEMLTRLGPQPYTVSPHLHTATMSPSQTGITTVMSIMAVWHALFSPMSTAVFLLPDAKAVKSFTERVNGLLAGFCKAYSLGHSEIGTTPGTIVIKTATVTNVRAQKSDRVIAVYVDTPDNIDTSELLNKIAITALASKNDTNLNTRFHIMTAGFNAPVAAVVQSGTCREIKFSTLQIHAKDLFTIDELADMFDEMGDAKFQKHVICAAPHDVNALARFNSEL